MRIDRGHGSPYDRGAADSYYRRGIKPHYFNGSTYSSEKVEKDDMTKEEILEYMQGYNDNESDGNHKLWE